ncbi:MAG: hypothetical protein RLZZ524_3003 [Pseudomonadota bacterium]|jgi:hypothetical protein
MNKPMDFVPAWYAELKSGGQCCGDCLQGDLPCKSPQACRLPEDKDDSEFGALEGMTRSAPVWIAAWVAIVAFIALIVFF